MSFTPLKYVSLVAFLSLIFLVASANAEHTPDTIRVTRFDDPRPPNQCSPNDCSLREAIVLSNGISGHQVIVLEEGSYVMDLGHGNPAEWYEDASYLGDLDIADDLTIRGEGPDATIVSQDPAISGGERAFEVLPSVEAAISGLAIQDLQLVFAPLDCGRGIRNAGTLTLTDVVIANNLMRGDGGGICNEGGTLTVTDSVIRDNCACFAGFGGGIYNRGGTAILERVTLSGNQVQVFDGGGLEGGTVIMTDSLVVGNETSAPFGERRGGGISAAFVTLTNVSIVNNRTDDTPATIGDTDSRGGGLSIFGEANLTNVTVFGNESGTTGGGIYAYPGATITLVNTIVAGNTGGDCEGSAVSGGHNIDGDGSCGLTDIGDIPNTDPLLGPLADNGGPTQTHALLPGSPALDTGDDNACPDADQRGAPRPAGLACDIGAFEADSVAPSPTPTPSPTATPEPAIQGDADCDGDTDAVDALRVLRFVAGFTPFADCLLLANVDCSLAVDSVDALFILRYIADLPVSVPPGCPAIGPP